MEWTAILQEIATVCLIPLLGILVKCFRDFVNIKMEQWAESLKDEKQKKYINMLNETIQNSVIATNQTYVDALKDKNIFDAEAQKEAFKQTYDSVIRQITEEMANYLTEIYGDLNEYIITKIESEVNVNKS